MKSRYLKKIATDWKVAHYCLIAIKQTYIINQKINIKLDYSTIK